MAETKLDNKTKITAALIFGPAVIIMVLMLAFVIWNAGQPNNKVKPASSAQGSSSSSTL